MIYLIIINIVFIFWIYKNYIYIPKKVNDNYVEVEEMDAALIGYIENENDNSIDWMLAEILELNRKDYIDIEYERTNINEYNYVMKKIEGKDISKLKKYELTAYRFLFGISDNKTDMNNIEYKMKASISESIAAEAKSFTIKNELEEELENRKLINKNLKLIKNELQIIHILITLIVILVTKEKTLYLPIILFIQTIIISCMIYQGRPFTAKGKELYAKVIKYKKELENNELLKEKQIAHNQLLQKKYADAIALHIPIEAKKEFINNELEENKILNVINMICKTNIISIIINIIIFVIYLKIKK